MSWIVKTVLWLLRSRKLTLADRNALSTAVLDSLEALPLRDIITASDEGILINGKQIELEKLRILREAAIAAIENQAFNLVGEQVRWVATERIMNKVTMPEDLYYYRAAIWFVEQMKAHLQILSQHSPNSPDSGDY